MTKKEKQLLIQDLCCRLPYGVKVHCTFYDVQNDDKLKTRDIGVGEGNICHAFSGHWIDFKPYLRPMSSMTEEEKRELSEEIEKSELGISDEEPNGFITDVANSSASVVNYCLRKHFDINNLIGKGLALEVPEGMYDIK